MESNEAQASPGLFSGFASKAVALLVLVIAAYVLFKVVIGVVTAVAWIVAICVAVIGVFWALSVLRR